MSKENDDKPFEASDQKLRKAREKGDIPRSAELNVAAMYLGAWLAFAVGAGFAVKAWLSMATRALGSEGWAPGATGAIAAALGQYAGWMVLAVAAVPSLVIVVALIAGRGLVFAPQKLAFDLNRINPMKTAGQKFGKSGLVNFGISLGKVALVCAGGWFLFRALLGHLAASPLAGDRWIVDLGVLLGRVLALALAVSILFAGLDMGWQWFDHRRKNRMSRKEMEDEYKDSEGDPHFKAARRQRAVDIATNQMLADVARADVVIVNPTHYAVALEWKRGSGRAPVCLAKGTDEVAARIRERARDHRVPIFPDPPCARAIHAMVEVGQEIRREQFAAVAAAIRFAEKMREKARAGW
ncbi:flagellar biosynthesis protein FlhB [Paracoccus sediminis]|uniref:Flagellar biosynthesis protein FlhB n=1 Tax=Paracoccus sediminis TaxID=1214787 RepID=A0A238X9E9_9RHOB|nr:flagellar type III secretion system protein FlhB [Paracoccus sediminis]TBN48998.1 flagellar biosynthesis protein FlhB [Paracoccus sediminis]SNR54479.1 flagellar biosynthetic protein FlhB [Paracoccus sediminis]